MSIGSTIKKLRHENDMTQEQLAELLGLTPAAISGWECDRNSPDISQIPQLSYIFDVSADILLGIDLTSQKEKIEKILERASTSTTKEAIEIYRTALLEFPTSYEIMSRLAFDLDYSGEPETYPARIKEQITLYEKIRENSKDIYYKNLAEGRLCGVYLRQGERDKALEVAKSIPKLMYSRDDIDKMLAVGKDVIYEMHHKIHGNFIELCDDIYFFTLQKIDEIPFFSHEEAILMLEKIPRLHEVFYENGDYHAQHWIFTWSYTRIAEHYAEMKDGDNALKYINSAFLHAKAADEYFKGLAGVYGNTDIWGYPLFPKEKRHTSILAKPELDYPTSTYWQSSNEHETYVDVLRRDLSHERFDFIRDRIEEI